ncbi:PH domain-containing protein [Streptomyces lavendofoliae]|uniref:PH domain-containing protein n=1 Tax=Streptomyces lavendofoliae TaxID=67314 RepID=UPI00300E8DD3
MSPGDGAGPDGWRRLDKRAVLVTALVMAGLAAGVCAPVLLGLGGGALFGDGPRRGGVLPLLAAAVVPVLGGAAVEYVRWSRTRYRIGPERAELHSGLLLVKRRSLARSRIRSVDLTAHPLLRVLGLVKVRIGTGEHTGGDSTLALHPVSRAEGERLRRELLARPAAPAGDGHRDGLLAALDPRWIRYAPLSFVAPLLGGAAAGGLMQAGEWFGAQDEVIGWVGDRFRDTGVGWVVLALGTAALLAGVVGALGLWVEMWWNHRLEREPGGTLRVRRGLLTTRSISVEERRLRGVEVVEPLGVRLAGAARVDAVATGIAEPGDDRHADHKTLLPPVPRRLAHEVAARVLREAVAPTGTPLTAHPRAARARRLRWGAGAALLPVLVLGVLGVVLTGEPAEAASVVAVGCALVLPPLAVLAALDAYRGLGHGISGAYLVTRSGTVRRATVALHRGGVIGWTVGQSYFQRRAGLVTLTATTAAGAGAYHVHDADRSEGLAFARAAVPGLLEPFLEPAPEARPQPDPEPKPIPGPDPGRAADDGGPAHPGG